MVPLAVAALVVAAGCAANGEETVATPEGSPTGTSASPTPTPASPSSPDSPNSTDSPGHTATPTPSQRPTAPRTEHSAPPRTDPPAGDPAGPPDTSLTIVVNTGTAEGAVEWTLTCDPPGGTHPDPDAACATLAEVDSAVLEPVPPDQRCTQIFGGPETATVTGELRGERLRAEFARNNGCEINRWDTLVDVLQVNGDGPAG